MKAWDGVMRRVSYAPFLLQRVTLCRVLRYVNKIKIDFELRFETQEVSGI